MQQKRKGDDRYTDCEGRNRTVLFTGDIIVFVENLKGFKKKFPGL